MITQNQINGVPPQLGGKVCEGLLCESFVYEGSVEATANVTYLKFSGIWYRLYFEPGLIFWRVADSDPRAWSVPQKGWNYPHTDVGIEAGVGGEVLESYEMTADDSSSCVTFVFRSGKRVVIKDEHDCSNYQIA